MSDIKHGTLSGARHHKCKCLPCAVASAAWQAKKHRQVAYGTWQPFVDAAPALAHIEGLHARGMTWQQVADAAGVYETDLQRLRGVGSRQRSDRIRPETERKLLAVEFTSTPASPLSMVPALGSRRRLQALRANGWSGQVLAKQLGVPRQTVGIIAQERQDSVTARTAQDIAELYEFLHDQDPLNAGVTPAAVERTARAAERTGWAPPRAWAGRSMDDPAAEPGRARGRGGYATAPMGSRRQALVEDTAELVRQGLPRDVIADRLGVTWNAVQQAHVRSGVPMPELAA
jgi:transcriptional regulator with XRE-family HTH domain